jgi:hypothetical protein
VSASRAEGDGECSEIEATERIQRDGMGEKRRRQAVMVVEQLEVEVV